MTDTRPALTPSDADPCVACPWRNTNRGKRHPDGWYTKANLVRLWSGLRRGEAMSCHPTDPDNVVSDRAQAAGYRPAPAGSQVLECRGGIVLQQRELHLLQEEYDSDYRRYRRGRPLGLTREGLAYLVQRIAFGGVPFFGGPVMPRPSLNSPVGYDRLPWTDVTDSPADPPGGQP